MVSCSARNRSQFSRYFTLCCGHIQLPVIMAGSEGGLKSHILLLRETFTERGFVSKSKWHFSKILNRKNIHAIRLHQAAFLENSNLGGLMHLTASGLRPSVVRCFRPPKFVFSKKAAWRSPSMIFLLNGLGVSISIPLTKERNVLRLLAIAKYMML